MKFIKIIIILFILFSLAIVVSFFVINLDNFTVQTLGWEKVEYEEKVLLEESKTEQVINNDLNKELIKSKIKDKLEKEL